MGIRKKGSGKETQEAARLLVQRRWEQEKGIQEAAYQEAKLSRDQEREEKKNTNREVAKLLRNENSVRNNLRNNLLSGDTETDGAGLEWRLEAGTSRWWWRDSEGEWQWEWHYYTRKSKTNSSGRNSVSSKSTASTASTAASTAATVSVSEEYRELQRMQ